MQWQPFSDGWREKEAFLGHMQFVFEYLPYTVLNFKIMCMTVSGLDMEQHELADVVSMHGGRSRGRLISACELQLKSRVGCMHQ